MRAVDDEAACAHRLQAFQRLRHPVDIGQRLALDLPVQRERGQHFTNALLGLVNVAVGVERHFVNVAILVYFHDSDGKALGLEFGFQGGEDAVCIAAPGREVKACLAHGAHNQKEGDLCPRLWTFQPLPARRFSFATAVSPLSP